MGQTLSVPREGVMNMDWSSAYQQSPYFEEVWDTIPTPVENWLLGVQLQNDKIYLDGR